MDNSEYWITSDTHFFHNNLTKSVYENRPKDYMMKLWQGFEVIGWNDVLIHLGDVIFHNYDRLVACLPNVYNILVLGNHDSKTKTYYINNGFKFVCNSFVYKDILFSHEPVSVGKLYAMGCYLNIHGHLHSNKRKKEYQNILTDKHFCYSPEMYDYKPLKLSKIIKMNQRRKYEKSKQG